MSNFSNSARLDEMINNIVEIHSMMAEANGMIEKKVLKEDIQMLVDEAKKEVREYYQNYVVDKDCDAKIINKDTVIWKSTQKYKKVYDPVGSDPKETCMKHCVFCKIDENGEPECGAPLKKAFWDCNAGFHWEEEK